MQSANPVSGRSRPAPPGAGGPGCGGIVDPCSRPTEYANIPDTIVLMGTPAGTEPLIDLDRYTVYERADDAPEPYRSQFKTALAVLDSRPDEITTEISDCR